MHSAGAVAKAHKLQIFMGILPAMIAQEMSDCATCQDEAFRADKGFYWG